LTSNSNNFKFLINL